MAHAAIERGSWIWLGGALFWAAVLWSVRRATPEVAPAWFYALLGLCALALLAGWRAARRIPHEEQIAAWLDARVGLGGAVLAARAYREELPMPTQDHRLECTSNSVPLSSLAGVLRIACGIGLALAALLMRVEPDATSERGELLQALVQRAAERFAELEADAAMSIEEREALQERLQELAERALSETDPTQLLEALGDIDQRMEEAVQRALAAAERASALDPSVLPPEFSTAVEDQLRAEQGQDGRSDRSLEFEGETDAQRSRFGAQVIAAGAEVQSENPAEDHRASAAQQAAHLRRLTPSQRRAVESFFGAGRKREAGR